MKHVGTKTLRTACVVAALSLSSCVAPQEDGGEAVESDSDEVELASTEQRLNGQITDTDSSCVEVDNILLPRLRAAFQEARRVVTSPLLQDCLANAFYGHNPHFTEHVLRLLRQDLPTRVQCVDRSEISGFDAFTPGGTVEFMKFAKDFVLLQTPASIAAVVLHELAHSYGYWHTARDNTSPSLSFVNSPEFLHSINEQLARCSLAISGGAARPSPNGARRDDMAPATILAPAGGEGGAGYERLCDAVTALRGRSGDLIDAIGVSCNGPNPDTSLAGSPTGGAPFTIGCNSNEFMVGIDGIANDTVLVGIGPLCASRTSVAARQRTTANLVSRGWRGGFTGDLFRRWCPAGMYVRGIRGRAGDLVDRIELDCMTAGSDGLPVGPGVNQTLTPRAGGSGGAMTIEKCAGEATVTGLHHLVDSMGVIRMGGHCTRLTKNCSGGTCTETVGGANHMLTGWGGFGGQVGSQSCPAGQALVGIDVQAGTLVDGIEGRCAPVTAWAGTGAEPALSSLGRVPLSIPNVFLRCPRRSFVTGWQIQGGARLDAIRLICRDF